MNKKKKRWIVISICGIFVAFIIIAVAIFIYRIQSRQTTITPSVLDSEYPFLVLDGSFTEKKIFDSESALAAIEEVASMIGIHDTDTELSIASEETVLNNTYYRFTQEYKGIPVYGRALIVSADEDDNVLSLSGNFRFIDGLETEPFLSGDDTLEVAREFFGDDATITNEGLTIYSLNGIAPELTWKLCVTSEETIEYCFLSAVNGDIVSELPLTYSERIRCYGEDVDGNTHGFYAEYENGEYIMMDSERDITIYDANNSTLKLKLFVMDSDGSLYSYDDSNFYDESGNIVYVNGNNFSFTITDEQGNVLGTDGEYVVRLWTDNVFTTVEPVTNDSIFWDNSKAVTLMTRISTVYNFWQLEYHRNSYDGKHGAVVGVYDDYKKGDTTNAESFGSPDVPITILNFGTDNSLDLEIVAHEFMHSVERSISNMSYESESGALKEAYSDIFGEIVEDWEDDGEYNNSCDWILGNRNMTSPGRSNPALPDRYLKDHWADTNNPSDTNDHGGVHTNCTVISHAAYLMSTGIGGNPAFESLSTKEIADLFYSTLFVITTDCTFEQFRSLVQNTANILCEQGILTDKQRACVSNAFFQVGIDSSSLLVSNHVSLDVYDINGEIYDNYTLSIVKGEELTDYTGTFVNSDGVTFNGIGDYELQIVDNANADNITTLTVQVVEDGGARQIPIYTRCGLATSSSEEIIINGEEVKWYDKILASEEGSFRVPHHKWKESTSIDIMQRNEFDCYTVVDLDGDGVEELFLYNYDADQNWRKVLVLTYHENQVKPLIAFSTYLGRSGIYIKNGELILHCGEVIFSIVLIIQLAMGN